MVRDQAVMRAISRILQRAERQESPEKIVGTFVDVGFLPQLNNHNNQVFYGRRGTGKTHVLKDKNAVKKCLDEQFQDERTKEIEIVCLLEKPPTPRENDETNKRWLWEVNARYVTYADLLTRAQKSYGEYLEKQKDVSELVRLIDDMERTFDPVV